MSVTKAEVVEMFNDVAKKALEVYDIDIIKRGWTVGFSRTTRAIGDCNYRKRLIRISTKFMEVNDYRQIKKTVIHEIAHAVAGYKGDYGHGVVWKNTDRRLGGDGSRLDSTADSPEHKWVVVNTADNNKIVGGYQRKPKRDFSKSWLNGRRAETEGKLRLMTSEQYERLVK